MPTSGDVASDSARDAAASSIRGPTSRTCRSRRWPGSGDSTVWCVGRRAGRAELAGQPGLLAGTAARRRPGGAAQPARVLVLARRHTDSPPRDAGGLDFVRRMMLNMDQPEHTRLRGLLGRAFTPRAVARLEDRIFATAHHLVEPALGHLRRSGRQRNGPRGAAAATRAGTGRPTARPAHPGGDGRPLRLRAPAG